MCLCYEFFILRKELIAIVNIIIDPHCIVSNDGCSLMNTHTQMGPIIVSSKKKRFTSAADINLGAIVTKTKGKATHITHIIGTIIISVLSSKKLSTKNIANIATISFPATAAGTRSFFFAYLTITAPIASPRAVTKPKKYPKKLPNCIES